MKHHEKFGVEMNPLVLNIVITGSFFVLIFLFGFWLNHSGKPYNTVIFTIHKLIALMLVLFLGQAIYKLYQTTVLSAGQITFILTTLLCFLSAMVSGALLSISVPMPAFVRILHQVVPYLSILSTLMLIYLLRNAWIVT